jgi:hypothetical protein
MRRIVVVLVLGLVAGVWPAARGVAHGSTVTQAGPAGSLQADFNNDGADDLAVGVPLDTVGAAMGAGAVNVLYGSATGLGGPGSQLFSQATPGVPAVPRPMTASAPPWRPATSTMTPSPTWRWVPLARASAPPWRPAR